MKMATTSPVRPSADKSDLTPLVIQRLATIVKRESGINLVADKAYLVESKLRPLISQERLSGFGELVEALEKNRRPGLLDRVSEAMTINETHFFRDRLPFDELRRMLSAEAAKVGTDRSLKIWSAACSTGQELYSIAIILEELGSLLTGWRVDLLGTDLADGVIAKARRGCYSQFEVQRGLSTPLLLKYFERAHDEWQICERIRKKAVFQRFNLLSDPTHLGAFDYIFCRNVLFYFEPATRGIILRGMIKNLRPNGKIVLGSTEAMSAVAAGLSPAAPGSCFFCKPQ